ncbi:MAG: hypothetical protein EBX55_08715, partial [Betaproteobacteria bacterium]|nr:hypothetical protein [Betaproteobacteria bacterium]
RSAMNAKPQDPRPGVSTHDRCLQSTDETAPASQCALQGQFHRSIEGIDHGSIPPGEGLAVWRSWQID